MTIGELSLRRKEYVDPNTVLAALFSFTCHILRELEMLSCPTVSLFLLKPRVPSLSCMWPQLLSDDRGWPTRTMAVSVASLSLIALLLQRYIIAT